VGEEARGVCVRVRFVCLRPYGGKRGRGQALTKIEACFLPLVGRYGLHSPHCWYLKCKRRTMPVLRNGKRLN